MSIESEQILLPQHILTLEKSGLSAETVKQRVYKSVETRDELDALGFEEHQGNVPGLVIPISDMDGTTRLHVLVPDAPRTRKGVVVLAEQPKGSSRILYVPTNSQKSIHDKTKKLIITSTPLLADAVVQRGGTAVGLLDRQAWRHHHNSKPLGDWRRVLLEGREVIVLFDGNLDDPLERNELDEFLKFLESKNALVVFGKLSGKYHGLTFGQAFHQGLELNEIETATPIQKYPALYGGHPYLLRDDGIYLTKDTDDGPELRKLANFTATVIEDIESTDEVTFDRSLRIEATLCGETTRFILSATEFEQMDWITKRLGVKAIVTPGYGNKDHVRAAIQIHSPHCRSSHEISHTGWVSIDGVWHYCHASGVIGPTPSQQNRVPSVSNSRGPIGPVFSKACGNISVDLPPPLRHFELPEPLPHDDVLRGLVARILIMMLDDLPERIIFPLLGAVFRAVLGRNNLVLHLIGDTGCFKSAIACVMQQFFGAGMNDEQIPGNWSSTANALESLAYHLKDSLLLVDDYSPTGSPGDVKQLQRYAEHFIRNKANQVSRGRSTSVGGYRGGRLPRALILSTGEDLPIGKSLRSRILTIEVNAGDIDSKALERYQRDANRGVFSRVMATFVQWLSRRYDTVLRDLDELNEDRSAYCDEQHEKFHKRTIPIVRQLFFGWEMFLEFAIELEVLNQKAADEISDSCQEALNAVAESQLRFIKEADPVENLLHLVWSLFASKRVYLLDRWSGMTPENDPECWGYRCKEIRVPSSDDDGFEAQTVWVPQGRMIGWLDNMHVYFIPEALYAEVQLLAQRAEISMPFTLQTMAKRLADRDILLRDPVRDRIRHRVTAEGRRQSVFKATIQKILWLDRFGLDDEERELQEQWIDDMLEA